MAESLGDKMRTFRPIKNEIKIYIDFSYEYTSMHLDDRIFYRSTEAITCKGDALDLQHTFHILQKQLKALNNHRPDLVSSRFAGNEMLPEFRLLNWTLKCQGKVNHTTIDLSFTDMEQFLMYLTENNLITDYGATNLFAIYYPNNSFNFSNDKTIR